MRTRKIKSTFFPNQSTALDTWTGLSGIAADICITAALLTFYSARVGKCVAGGWLLIRELLFEFRKGDLECFQGRLAVDVV